MGLLVGSIVRLFERVMGRRFPGGTRLCPIVLCWTEECYRNPPPKVGLVGRVVIWSLIGAVVLYLVWAAWVTA